MVFSIAPIDLVQIQINDDDWKNASNVKGPLYIVPWQPEKYGTGIHSINVRSRDREGRERGITQPFSIDETTFSFKFWPRLVLMTNISTVVSFTTRITNK